MASKKRAADDAFINGNEDDDQGEHDDEKMEQFFALIRNFHEARSKRKDELRQREEKMKHKKENKKRRLDNEQYNSSWVPSFEWSDFSDEIEFRRPPVIFPSPYNKKDDKKNQEDDDKLDLKLTL